jgi:hypothetical protein
MTKQPNGIWTIKFSIPPGTYGYNFLLGWADWVFDPKNPRARLLCGRMWFNDSEDVAGRIFSIG